MAARTVEVISLHRGSANRTRNNVFSAPFARWRGDSDGGCWNARIKKISPIPWN